ncbi:TPA: hypothetical protein L4E43_001731 [Pseudomonas aeruginosa]|nr:hypothetical protein [Pseudomonas aeruginosa]
MIDWSKVKTAEQQAQERWQAEYDAAAVAARADAYRLESDPLKTEAEFDAIKAGTEPDYSAWIAKVEEIKARIPLPSPLAE